VSVLRVLAAVQYGPNVQPVRAFAIVRRDARTRRKHQVVRVDRVFGYCLVRRQETVRRILEIRVRIVVRLCRRFVCTFEVFENNNNKKSTP